MNTCTFFGHRETPDRIEPILRSALIDLIEKNKVDTFYVGTHGNFDKMVKRVLGELKMRYPHIRDVVVLAYLPRKTDETEPNTLYPEGLETVPPRYAIIKRNQWMIAHSDRVVTYVTHGFGGAAKCKELAEKQGKIVIDLAALQ